MKLETQVFHRWAWDPFLPPDWRAKDVGNVLAGEMTEWADDDDMHVAAYAQYLRSPADTGQGPIDQAASPQWLAINAAHKIAMEEGPCQWELKARVLADQPIEEIAARFGVSPAVLTWFEAVFFDVRVRLGARMWISNRVIGNGHLFGFRDDELGALWGAFGFHGGVPVVNTVVDAFYSTWRPGEPATIAVYFRDDCPISLEMKVAIAASSIPVTEQTNRQCMKIHARLLKIKATMRPGKSRAAIDAQKREMIRLWHSTRSKNDDTQHPLPKRVLVEEAMVGKGRLQSPNANHPSPDIKPFKKGEVLPTP